MVLGLDHSTDMYTAIQNKAPDKFMIWRQELDSYRCDGKIRTLIKLFFS